MYRSRRVCCPASPPGIAGAERYRPPRRRAAERWASDYGSLSGGAASPAAGSAVLAEATVACLAPRLSVSRHFTEAQLRCHLERRNRVSEYADTVAVGCTPGAYPSAVERCAGGSADVARPTRAQHSDSVNEHRRGERLEIVEGGDRRLREALGFAKR